MEILGFSAAKILTILIIAIIIFGPDKVPEMARTVGRTIRDVRRYMTAMTAEFNDATGGLREEFTEIAQDLKGELAATQADLRSQLDLTSVFAEAAATIPPVASPAAPSPAPEHRVAVASAVPSADDPHSAHDTLPEVTAPLSDADDRGTRRATKANPLADLVVLAAHRPDRDATPSQNGHGKSKALRQIVGRSVAGSAYRRRKGPASKGLCRSAHVRPGVDIHGLTALHATRSARVAAR